MKNHLKRVAAIVLGLSGLSTALWVQPQGVRAEETADHPPIAIHFHLDRGGFVTLVIEKPDGTRVRNLVSETPFEAGENTAWWDGLDDLGRDTNAASFGVYHIPGKQVDAGAYKVRGLVRPALHAIYEFTPYSHGNPPWKTKDASSEWLGNHTAPNAMLYLPPEGLPAWPEHPAQDGQIVVGSFVTEGGSGMAFLDKNGNKLHGIGWIGGNWTGAAYLARDIGPKPIRGVYVYSASAWRIEDGFAELRFTENYLPEIKTRNVLDPDKPQERPVLPETFKFAAPAVPNESATTFIHGIAVYNGIVVASLPHAGQLMFIDDARHAVLGVAAAVDPRGVAFDHQGRLLLISGQKVVRYELPAALAHSGEYDPKVPRKPPQNQPPNAHPEASTATEVKLPEPTVVIGSGLKDPCMIAVDASDRIYVTDNGNSNQVKVFKADGTAFKTIGDGGVAGIGPYNPNQMRNPVGLSIDADGLIWVAENDKAPKRISAWNLNGKLAKAFYGPAKYGGGGWVDPVDKTRFYYPDDNGAIEFKLDWQTGTAVPSAVYFRPEDDTLKIRSSGLPGDNDGRPPAYPIHVGARTYLTDAMDSNATGGISIATLWNLDKGVAHPVAAMGQLNDWPLFGTHAHYSIVWTGQIEPKYSETYEFQFQVDYGGRVYIDGKPVVDRSSPRNKNTGSVALEAGKKYDIRIEMESRGGAGRATLEWSSPSQKLQVIPDAVLTPPVGAGKEGMASGGEHGLRGEYYVGDKFDHLIGTRMDAKVDFNWHSKTPEPLMTERTQALQKLLPEKADLSNDRYVFVWSDKNGDGLVDPDEIQIMAGDCHTVTIAPDLSMVTAAGLVYRPVNTDERGVPIYDLGKPVDFHVDVNKVASSGGGQALLANDGSLILTTAPKPFSNHSVGGLIGGKTGWSYPSLWPGLHASHNAAPLEFPGELIGTTRLIGGTVTPPGSDAGEIWGINGNKGTLYFFTSDGLFVGTLFKDGRTASWSAPQALRGMNCDEFSLNEECFFPSMTQTSDGKVYITATWCGSIVRVDGLDGIRRIPAADLSITQDDLAKANAWFLDREIKRREAAAKSGKDQKMIVSIRKDPPKVDGDLSDWPNVTVSSVLGESPWTTIDQRTLQVGDWGHRKIVTQAAMSVAGDNLYIALKTDDAHLLENSGESLPLTFKTGGAIDLQIALDPKADPKRTEPVAGDVRLLVTMAKGKPLAVLYRPVAADRKGDKVTFTSPMRSVYMDKVDDVSSGVQIATGVEKDLKNVTTAVTYEISIPLSALGLKPAPGLVLHGDIGVLRGNGFETLDRVYWHNKASGLVSDVPSEAELLPKLWGAMEFK